MFKIRLAIRRSSTRHAKDTYRRDGDGDGRAGHLRRVHVGGQGLRRGVGAAVVLVLRGAGLRRLRGLVQVRHGEYRHRARHGP